MKKLIITALVGAAVCVSYGQGTINFLNTSSTTISFSNAINHTAGIVPVTGLPMYYGVFAIPTNGFATGADAASALVLASSTANVGYNSATLAGRIASPLGASSVPYPLTYAVGTTVWLQVRAWDQAVGPVTADSWKTARDNNSRYYYGESEIKAFTLAAASGPGVVIFGTTAARLPGFSVVLVPEPSTIALVGVGLAGLLFLRRRK